MLEPINTRLNRLEAGRQVFFRFVILFYILWTRGGAIMGTMTEIFTIQPDGKYATIEQLMAAGRRPEGGDRS